MFASTTSVVGYKDIVIKKGGQINGNIGVNKNLNARGVTLPAPYAAYLGPKAKAKGFLGTKVIKATDFFPLFRLSQ